MRGGKRIELQKPTLQNYLMNHNFIFTVRGHVETITASGKLLLGEGFSHL